MFLAERLVGLEDGLARTGSAPAQVAVLPRVRRDLDLLQQVRRRSA
jgi:hypothetical protein